jgi:hypothetical protein
VRQVLHVACDGNTRGSSFRFSSVRKQWLANSIRRAKAYDADVEALLREV